MNEIGYHILAKWIRRAEMQKAKAQKATNPEVTDIEMGSVRKPWVERNDVVDGRKNPDVSA